VTVLESGPWHDIASRPEYSRRRARGEDPWRTALPGLDAYTTGGSVAYPLAGRRARGVGGSTLHWEGYALRLHADDFRLRTRHGIAHDWPLGYDHLEPYYGRAERALGVAGADDDPWASPRRGPFPLPAFSFGYTDGIFVRACRELDIAVHHLPQARNSVPWAGRPRCRAYATCHACPIGAQASTDLTHARRLALDDRSRLLTGVTVQRLETDAAGRVAAAVYAGHDRIARRISARIFVLAAGAVENVRLLLLSRSPAFPAGLANRSGVLGKYFMSHPVIDVTGRVREPVYPYRVGFSAAMSRQFAVARDRARTGAFLLEFLQSAGGRPFEIALTSGLWGEALRRRVAEEFGHTLGIRVYCEQLPSPDNTVTLDSDVLDYFGNPVPRITYSLGAYERTALADAAAIASRILERAGASNVGPGGLNFAAHQMGTHRMGEDPRSSVVDATLRAHDVPNLYLLGSGAFVTSAAAPPTLTIVALALRAADHIAAHVRSPDG
jgi:choline dehydrogenase-like flavoprotein